MKDKKYQTKTTHFPLANTTTPLDNIWRDNAIRRLDEAIDMAVTVLEISGGIRLERFKSNINKIIEYLVPIENRIYYGGDPALTESKNRKAEKLFKRTKQLLEDLGLDTKALDKNKRLQEIIDNLRDLKEIVCEPFILEKKHLKNFVSKVVKEIVSHKSRH